MSEEFKRLLKALFEADYNTKKHSLESYVDPELVHELYLILNDIDHIIQDFTIPAWRILSVTEYQSLIDRFEPIELQITELFPPHSQIRKLSDRISIYLEL